MVMDALVIPKFICDFLYNCLLEILEWMQVRWQIDFFTNLMSAITFVQGTELLLKFVICTSRAILSSWNFLWSWWSLPWCYSTILSSCMWWTSCKSAETVNAVEVLCIPGTSLCIQLWIQGNSLQGKDNQSCSKTLNFYKNKDKYILRIDKWRWTTRNNWRDSSFREI